MGLVAFMNAQTDVKNVIFDIEEARIKLGRPRADELEPALYIADIYTHLSDDGARLRLDQMMTAFCGASLGDLLKNYDPPPEDIPRSWSFNAP
jgi:hypothetical protein